MLPREKLQQRGIESLTNQDLVGAIISTGSKGQDFQKISKMTVSVMKKSIKGFGEISTDDLTAIKGVGDVKAIRLLAGIELGKRLFGLTSSDRELIQSTQEAYLSVKSIASLKQEVVIALFLNARFELIEKRKVSMGTVNSTSISPRDILIPALESNCAYIIIAHNHPSGSLEASAEDIKFTKRLRKACDIVGVSLLDHIIVSDSNWASVPVN